MIHSNEHLQIKMDRLNGKQCDSRGHTTTSTARLFSFVCLFVFGIYFKVCFVFVFLKGQRRMHGIGQKQGYGEINGIGMHDVKIPEKQ